MPDETKMTLGEHIEELRRSLIRAVVGVAVGMAICLALGDQIMQWMCWPIAAAMRSADLPIHLRTLAPAESFSTYFKVCLSLGVILSAPYGLWQICTSWPPGCIRTNDATCTRPCPSAWACSCWGRRSSSW